MKRSEMIADLDKNISMLFGAQSNLIASEWILGRLEKLGMMPPIIENKSFTILENGELTYAVHEWEPEEITPEELIANGVCPCGDDNPKTQSCCSVTGCPMIRNEK